MILPLYNARAEKFIATWSRPVERPAANHVISRFYEPEFSATSDPALDRIAERTQIRIAGN
jgi:hypothetical protein